MKRRLTLLFAGLTLATSLTVVGCKPKEEPQTKEEAATALKGTGDYSKMPPEARKAMEESMKNAKKGPDTPTK